MSRVVRIEWTKAGGVAVCRDGSRREISPAEFDDLDRLIRRRWSIANMQRWLRDARQIPPVIYRIERDGARRKGQPWARLRAFRNAAWIVLQLPPMSRTPLASWLEPKWSRVRRRLKGAP